jgi:hypothetical protein
MALAAVRIGAAGQEAGVSLRWRQTLALVGLALIIFALAAVAYAAWPIDSSQEQFRPAPTLFAPPEAARPIHQWT